MYNHMHIHLRGDISWYYWFLHFLCNCLELVLMFRWPIQVLYQTKIRACSRKRYILYPKLCCDQVSAFFGGQVCRPIVGLFSAPITYGVIGPTSVWGKPDGKPSIFTSFHHHCSSCNSSASRIVSTASHGTGVIGCFSGAASSRPSLSSKIFKTP